MLTKEQLEDCYPIKGVYPFSALTHYYTAALHQVLTDDDVRQIVAFWNEKLNPPPPKSE